MKSHLNPQQYKYQLVLYIGSFKLLWFNCIIYKFSHLSPFGWMCLSNRPNCMREECFSGIINFHHCPFLETYLVSQFLGVHFIEPDAFVCLTSEGNLSFWVLLSFLKVKILQIDFFSSWSNENLFILQSKLGAKGKNTKKNLRTNWSVFSNSQKTT